MVFSRLRDGERSTPCVTYGVMIRIVGICAGGTLPSFAAGSHVSTYNVIPSRAVSVWRCTAGALSGGCVPYRGWGAGCGSHGGPPPGAEAPSADALSTAAITNAKGNTMRRMPL